MSPKEFGQQMDRLKNVFGERDYPQERIELIYREVNSLPLDAFKRVVDELLGSCRQAPLLPDFRKLIAVERETGALVKKRQEERDLTALREWAETKGTPEVKAIMEKIKKRTVGNMSDDEYVEFIRELNEAAREDFEDTDE